MLRRALTLQSHMTGLSATRVNTPIPAVYPVVMEGMQTMERTEIQIDGVSAMLAQDQDLGSLMQKFAAASNGPAQFVEFVVVGNRRVRVLVNEHTRVRISSAAVQYDPRDNGDEEAPWGGLYDIDAPML